MEQNGIERNYMEFVFSPQGLAVDISNGILKSDDAGLLYCSKIETSDISNNSITSDKLNSNITLSGLNVNVVTGSSIYSDTITCNNLYVMNSQELLTSSGVEGETGPPGENGPPGETGATGPHGLPGIDITGEFIFGENITANNIYATTITTTADSFVNSVRIGQGTSTGSQNTAFGINALDSSVMVSAYDNTAIGHDSLTTNTTGINNTSIGSNAFLNNTSGYNNTAVGAYSQFSHISGWNNVSIGNRSLYMNQSGVNNIAIGQGALNNNIYHANVGIGGGALRVNTSGVGNVAIGYGSGGGNVGITGNTGGINCTFIGLNTNSGNSSYTNSTAIGANSVITASNQIVLGNSSVSEITTTASLSAQSVISETILYSSGTTMNLTTSSPQNILITTVGTTLNVNLPNSPTNGTSFMIVSYSFSTLNINAAGTNTILHMSRPSTNRNPINSTGIQGSSLSNIGSTYASYSFKIIYYNGIWYLTKRSVT
jgi:hypothetical protein